MKEARYANNGSDDQLLFCLFEEAVVFHARSVHGTEQRRSRDWQTDRRNDLFRNRKHIEIDDLINIDFIQGDRQLHEIKKSRKMEAADVLQVKYYLYYLKKMGVEGFTAKIDYPLLKRTLDVALEEKDELEMERIIKEIENVVATSVPPPLEKKRYCKSCSYCELCWI